jgi:N-acylneuraminate cytidylyltransferase
MPSIIAFIPARSGSKRIPGKNVKPLGGHPLLAYSIDAARRAGLFVDVVVSTDSEEYREIALGYGASVPFLRPAALASDTSPDIEWVLHALDRAPVPSGRPDAFAILRPTSPFRSAGTIRRAWSHFLANGTADSLRAVEPCAQHPAKMWIVEGARMRPVMANPDPAATPWHSCQHSTLPPIWVQNASLEIAWTRVPLELGTIAGSEIVPFFTEGREGFDLNRPENWIVAEHLVGSGAVRLPEPRRR